MLVHHRIFDAFSWYPAIQESTEQRGSFAQFIPEVIESPIRRRIEQPSHAAVAESRAWWMKHRQQIPTIIKIVARITDKMLVAAILGWQQVARPRVMATRGKGATDNAGKFAGNKNAGHQEAF
jgi:formylglycine-generating enzyme required for sulfatase activity